MSKAKKLLALIPIPAVAVAVAIGISGASSGGPNSTTWGGPSAIAAQVQIWQPNCPDYPGPYCS